MNHSAARAWRARRDEKLNQPKWETAVWECGNPSCPCWMRKDMAFEEEPDCPLCQTKMHEALRPLPRISNREIKY